MGLFSILKRVVGSRFFPLYLVYVLLKKLKLWQLLLLIAIYGPSMIGTYSYLMSEGVSPWISVIATVGIQFGGQIIEVWNALWQLQGAGFLAGFVIVSGSALSIARLLTFFYVFNWISDNLAPTVPNAVKMLTASIFLLFSTAVAVILDQYVLTGGAHLSGWTYVLSNPDIVTQPLAQVVGQAASDPAAQEALNKTVNNSNVTG